MTTPLQPQAALEQAVVNTINGASITDPATISAANCARCYDGKPHPRCGNFFISVWSKNGRQSQSREALDEIFSLRVTVTVRFIKPFDRWVYHRDQMEELVNRIRALIHKDSYDFSVTRAAMVLASYTWDRNNTTDPVGWCEALALDGIDDMQDAGPAWFAAEIGEGKPLDVGAYQTIRFSKSRRVQAMAHMQ